jgi:hypothetical protein
MDSLRVLQEFRFEHRHDDGSWAPMEGVPPSPSDRDTERSWSKGRIFRCKSCNEQIRIAADLDDELAPEPAFREGSR